MAMKNCKFKEDCKHYSTSQCSEICYPYVFLHGMDGNGGMWATRNVPKKYENWVSKDLPSGNQFDKIRQYCGKLPTIVEGGTGLYLFSKATEDNKFGTGNGKTTSALSILNEFTILQTKRHIKGEIRLEHNPSLFVKASDFQNVYNSQFRGTFEMQETSSVKYYKYKELMKNVTLLVFDDIAIRNGTEAFLNEMYEIIDHRCTEELATIFTSNLPLDRLTEIFGDRIVSRIEGMTVPIPFVGKDIRKKSF